VEDSGPPHDQEDARNQNPCSVDRIRDLPGSGFPSVRRRTSCRGTCRKFLSPAANPRSSVDGSEATRPPPIARREKRTLRMRVRPQVAPRRVSNTVKPQGRSSPPASSLTRRGPRLRLSDGFSLHLLCRGRILRPRRNALNSALGGFVHIIGECHHPSVIRSKWRFCRPPPIVLPSRDSAEIHVASGNNGLTFTSGDQEC